MSLEQFWIDDIPFSVDLLKQFLEDMDAYSNVSCVLCLWIGYMYIEYLTALTQTSHTVFY